MKTESIPPSSADHDEIVPHKRDCAQSLHPNWLDCFKSERDRLVLLPRSPSSIFAYWEWTPSRTEEFRNSSLNGELILKLFNAEDKTPAEGSPAAVCVAEFPCMWDSLKMYIKPPERGQDYYAALFIRTAAGDFQTLLKSNTVQVPAGKPAGDSDSAPGTGYTERFKKP